MEMSYEWRAVLAVVTALLACCADGHGETAIGDPGMKRDALRVAFEAWNFCNEVGSEAPNMGSPRAADCFDIATTSPTNNSKRYYNSKLQTAGGSGGSNMGSNVAIQHKVTDSHNKLGVGKPFPGLKKEALTNPDLYAAQKEVYLGSLCEVNDDLPWHFWMVMLKNGNFDTKAGLCPQNGKKIGPFSEPGRFPCFGPGCMNQPTFYHHPTSLTHDDHDDSIVVMKGGFEGTYELGSDIQHGIDDISYYEVTWEKQLGQGSWAFKHKLKTSKKYPWLMLYLRADATQGFSGGYHYDTRGMLKTLPESPNFKVKVHLDIKQGGGPKSQFYLLDIGSCWKNNGDPCDGDVLTDVTRYSEMIINPETQAWCGPNSIKSCPPYHITPNNTKIHRTDTAHFPYGAYHYYCRPGNALHPEQPSDGCDPYSNPQAQEIVQLLPHPIWAEYGYPTKPGQGWVGDPKTWELDVGGLSSRLYFYQDPGTPPAKRIWTSIDMGTEIFVSDKDEIAEWTVSDFNVIITS